MNVYLSQRRTTLFRDCGQALRMRVRRAGLSLRLFAGLLAVIGMLGSANTACWAQLCSTTHTTDLYCLLPATYHTPAAPFNALFTPFGTELSELPTARPAGAILGFEHGALVVSHESLGAVFSERPESVGKERIFLGATYQNFSFSRLDSLNLKQVPIVLYYPPDNVYTATNSRFDVRVGQYALVAALGITSRIDVSVAVPFENVSFAATVNGTEYGNTGVSATFQEHVPGSAYGLADVVVGAKALVLERGDSRLAGGVDVRLPSGDELNFLGSGTVGVRPYAAYSHRGRVSPHLNVGYQWNGNSILNPNNAGDKQQLPTNFFYAAGANLELGKRWTVTEDVLGKRFFSAPRLTAPTEIAIPNAGNALSVQPYVGSYTTTDFSVGFKARLSESFLATGNVTLKLNDGGLRATAVPLLEVSYSF